MKEPTHPFLFISGDEKGENFLCLFLKLVKTHKVETQIPTQHLVQKQVKEWQKRMLIEENAAGTQQNALCLQTFSDSLLWKGFLKS